MKKLKELKLSDRLKADIRKILEQAGTELRREMIIGDVDHMQISLDLNFNSTGKFMGVKWSAFKAERVEEIYDIEVNKNE